MTLGHPDPVLAARILAEIALVRAAVPWIPFVGVRAINDGRFFYSYDQASHTDWITTPMPPYTPDDATLRRITRHELGHLFERNVYDRKVDPYVGLGVDRSHPLAHEIIAEIFARTLGVDPSYPALAPLTMPSSAREAFIAHAGDRPDTLEARVQIEWSLRTFWQRTDLPDWFREWATSFQTWITLRDEGR